MGQLTWYLVGSVVGSVVASWLVYPLLVRWNVIDQPNERSSHSRPTARGGGVGFITVILGGGLWYLISTGNTQANLVLVAAGFLALVSFVDDNRPLHAGIRFGCHGIAATAAIWFLFGIGRVQIEDMYGTSGVVKLIVLVLLFLWIAGYTNAFNFMDGINGLVSMQGFITTLGSVLIVIVNGYQTDHTPIVILLSIGGACLGFLPHNFPRARMFMGDVGSAPLGYLIAIMVVWLALIIDIELLIPLILLHANFVLDTGITLLRRIMRRERWYEAHNEHFYQKLIRAGKSHMHVTLTEALIQIVVLLILLGYPSYSNGIRCFTGLFIIGIWLAFFFYAERMYIKSAGYINTVNEAGMR